MRTEETDRGTLEHWTPHEVLAARGWNKLVLIDVRTPQEFAVERIDGALLAPMQSLSLNHLPDDGEKRIVFQCGSGVRSREVAMRCLKGGAGRVAHLEGGLAAWKEAGLEYTGIDKSTGAPVHLSTSV